MGTQLIIDATHVERIVFSALTLLLVLHVLIYRAMLLTMMVAFVRLLVLRIQLRII